MFGYRSGPIKRSLLYLNSIPRFLLSVMATRLAHNKTPNPFDTITQQIEDETDKVIQLILSRKKCLLIELSDYRFRYDNLVANRSNIEKELLKLKRLTEDLTLNELKEMQDKMLSDIEDRLKNINLTVTSFKLDFHMDTHMIKREIKKLGKIVACKIPKYSGMKTPVVAIGKKGKERHELNAPRGIAFEDKSELIFVCDNFNSCVKVFKSTGEFVNDFGSKELYRPWGILLHEDHIYVTDLDNCTLLKYQRSNYQFLLSVGKKGSGSGDFNCPGQLAIGHDQCVYVPERENNRISVLDTELNFKRYFKHENIVSPVDVKFTEDTMYILNSKSDHSFNSFNFDGDLIGSFRVKAVSYFFTIDCIGNRVFSLCGDHSVLVVHRDRKLLCSIGKEGNEKGELHFPYGICTTRNGNLIVASDNMNYGLQIF